MAPRKEVVKSVPCGWCGRKLASAPVGRPKKYCRQSCRQRAYESRLRSNEVGLSEDELIVTRNERDDANDRLFLLSSALSDAHADVDDGVSPATVLKRLISVLEATIGENP